MKKLLVLLMSFGLVFSVYSSDQWTKANPTGATNLSDLDASITANNAALDRLLIEYRGSTKIEYASTSTITVTSGQVACSNSAGSVVRWRRNTSDTTVSWTMLDTSSEAASTTYYLWAVADTDVATFTVTISTSSSAPSGKTYYARLGSFYNDSSSNILNDNTIVNDNETAAKQYGTLVSRSGNVAYLSTSDGFVTAYTAIGVENKYMSGYTDGSNPPTTRVAYNDVRGAYSNSRGTCCVYFPVKKGNYWKVTTDATVGKVYWIPNE